jgi:hypothetical protein
MGQARLFTNTVPVYFSIIPIFILIQTFYWYATNEVDFLFIKPMTRQDEPRRFWFVIACGALLGPVLLALIAYHWFTTPNWH